MYLGVDIGGSKTLFAVFSTTGKLVREIRMLTPADYQKFLTAAEAVIKNELSEFHFSYACCAMPGRVDRRRGVGLYFGNLKWQNVPLQDNLSGLLNHVPVLLENDANLAGLSEAILVHKKYKKVMYLTVSTGIKSGIIINGKIDPDLADNEPGQMILEHEGKLQKWEAFASGKALVKKYGKKASELNDRAAWADFVKGLALGIGQLMAEVQPEVIIIGGGVGSHFEKFDDLLRRELQKFASNLVPLPPVIKARRPEEAVIYGCYDFIRQKLG